jgi:Ca2+-binding EF-hand superfamily protein
MKTTQQILMSLGVFTLSTCIAVAQDSAPKGEGGGRIAEFLKRADTNADGKISLDEFNEFSKRDTGDRFSKMDANADGFVDATEMGQIGERMREGMRRPGGEGSSFRRPGSEGGEGGFRRPPGGSPEGERPAPKPEGERPAPRPEGERPMPPEGQRPGGPGGPGVNIDEAFGRMDKNGDGNVDKEEYTEFSKQEIETRFGRMDENADGKVSKEEMKLGMDRLRNMMRGPGGPGGAPGAPGGMRRPGGEGGPPGGGEGGFRRPPTQGDTGRPRPEAEADAPKKDPA